MATAIFLHLRPNRHRQFLHQNATSCLRFYSSSNSDDNGQNRTSPSQSPFFFSDVKASLKHPQPPPQHTPRTSFFTSNPTTHADPTQKVSSLEDTRKALSEFRRRSTLQPPPPSSTPLFQDLYKRNVDTESANNGSHSLKSIRTSLKSISNRSPENVPLRSPLRDLGVNLGLRPRRLNEGSIEENNEGYVSTDLKSEFVRTYGHREMGMKLKELKAGNKKTKFSLEELSERVKLFREKDEKEMKEAGGLTYGPIRDSLAKMNLAKINEKKKQVPNISVLAHLSNAKFDLDPPKDALVEKYFHPDHMSSAEKQKVELKNVREKFKISESDCGSARVQVAQLTTKIKHLATVLHKKDKHSRKGLQAMVQKRKKLLKYLRRTDWDSYCFCLSELGLRDSAADYKAYADYKA